MGLHIIIDGYNLIRQSKDLRLLDRQDIALGRETLIARLAAYRKFKPHPITVVFDGSETCGLYAPRDRTKGIHVVFSCGGETADNLIVRMARRERERALVVSSDAAVVRAAEACGATSLESPEFEARMAMAEALAGVDGSEEEASARRLSTRKKGEGRRLPKRLRRQRSKTAKL